MRLSSFVKFVGTISLLLPGTIPSIAATPAARPPNIVVILSDDLGYGDLGCYGQERFRTPNLDALAKRGVRFTTMYAGSSVCAPSRCVLLTGLHTGHAAIRGNYEVQPEGQAPMPADTVTLARLLRAHGYATGAYGKWGLGFPGSEGAPLKQGFDHFFGYNCQRLDHSYYPDHLWDDDRRLDLPANARGVTGVYAPALIQQRALAFLDANRDRPFFLYLASPLPHAEMYAPESYLAQHRGKYGPETPFQGVDAGAEFRKGPYASQAEPKAAYAAMIEILDQEVGEVMAKLAALHLTENTIVIFTSDNGAAGEGGIHPDDFGSTNGFRGFKRDLYEGGIRVPMIASWPGHIPAGRVTDQIAAFWDLLPTLTQFAGVPAPTGIDGVSLVPTLTGHGTQAQHEFLYWEFHELDGRVAVRQGKWKGVRYHVAVNPNSPLELYDLTQDEHEDHNVAADHPDVVARLDGILRSARIPSALFNFRSSTYDAEHR